MSKWMSRWQVKWRLMPSEATSEQTRRRTGDFAWSEGFHRALLVHVGHPAVEGGELAETQAQVLREARFEPAEGLDPLGEEDEPVLRVGRLPAEGLAAADGREERLVLGELAGPDAFHRLVEFAERRRLGGDGEVLTAVAFALAAGEAGRDGRPAGGGTGEERLFEGHDEEVAGGGTRRGGAARSPMA